MVFNREVVAAATSNRSRSNGVDGDSQHGFRSHSLLHGIINGKSRVQNISTLQNGSQLSKIMKKKNTRNQT